MEEHSDVDEPLPEGMLTEHVLVLVEDFGVILVIVVDEGLH